MYKTIIVLTKTRKLFFHVLDGDGLDVAGLGGGVGVVVHHNGDEHPRVGVHDALGDEHVEEVVVPDLPVPAKMESEGHRLGQGRLGHHGCQS